jgi:hypothetical protein
MRLSRSAAEVSSRAGIVLERSAQPMPSMCTAVSQSSLSAVGNGPPRDSNAFGKVRGRRGLPALLVYDTLNRTASTLAKAASIVRAASTPLSVPSSAMAPTGLRLRCSNLDRI